MQWTTLSRTKTAATLISCSSSSVGLPFSRKSFFSLAPLVAPFANSQNFSTTSTIFSLIIVVILKSPPPSRGSASDSSVRRQFSIFLISFVDGKLDRTEIGIPFSSITGFSTNIPERGARKRSLSDNVKVL